MNSTDNKAILDYIKENIKNLGTTDNKNNEAFFVKIYENFYNKNVDKYVFFYTQEDIEKISGCKDRQILEIDDSGKKVCKNCDDICNSKDKCLNNKECAIFCSENCDAYEKTVGNSDKNKCGSVKSASSNNNDKIEKNKIYDTPIDENSNLPEFSKIFNIGIKVIFVLLCIYICYIFYQIYGETVFTLINLLINIIVYIFYYIYYIIKWFWNAIIRQREWNSYEFKYIWKDYLRENADAKYERVISKLNSLATEMRPRTS